MMNFKTTIDVAALKVLIGRPAVAVLDCRFDLAAPAAGRQAYLRQHIPTARYADLNRDLSGPPSSSSGRHPLPQPERIGARLAELGVGDASQLIGPGYPWRYVAAAGALESGESPGPPPASTFTARVEPSAVVSTAELIEALKSTQHLLVDARAAERFTGAVEPLDPVAGHVPGAVNHPFSANLDSDGRFLPSAQLERLWLERLAGTPPPEVMAMCGSGVTACHNLLALEMAGLKGARLYAGSWSEWIRDPRRPVARGK